MIASSTYHSLLRISTAVVAIMLLFVSGVVTPLTAQLASNTERYLANATVGVSVGVPQNDVNAVTTALTSRQHELDQREQALAEREIAIGITDGSAGAVGSTATSTLILSSLLFVLLVLIILNYILDYLRSRERGARRAQQAV
jgi:hypothetical protein